MTFGVKIKFLYTILLNPTSLRINYIQIFTQTPFLQKKTYSVDTHADIILRINVMKKNWVNASLAMVRNCLYVMSGEGCRCRVGAHVG